MLGLGRVKRAVRKAIARHHRASVVVAVHGLASFFESAWHNDDPEFATSGEQFVLERLQSADFRLAVDVGANVGDWTRAALALWPNCRVHAFEVAPATYAELEQTMAGLHLPPGRIQTHAVGLSDQPGVQRLYYYPDHPKLTGDVARHVGRTAVPFDARMETLDAFCGERGIEAIDYLKIDVEGAEHRVLKGARRLLESNAISCIQFEHGAFWLDSRFLLRDYYDLLAERFFIGKIHPRDVAFSEYDWRGEDLRFSNYLCIAKSRPDLQRLFTP
jgi:FkbM family methyltransferase